MVGENPETVLGVPSKKRATDLPRKPETLENARVRFAKLLRARIAEAERELEALRVELASLGENPVARRTQTCSLCGEMGHTKRTCPERGRKKAEKSE